MKLILLFILTCCCCIVAFAHHNKGGTMMYTYIGAGTAANTSKYQITVQHYINCERESDEPNQIYLGIFDGASDALVKTVTISRSSASEIQKKSFNPCINPAPTVCFYLVTYVTTVELSNNTAGYILSEQDCCRADGTLNVSNPSNVGFTNTTSIPGVINGITYRNNGSPVLVIRDTAVICHNFYFEIDFSATDPDGDALTYTFCAAKASGSSDRQPNPPSGPPYSDVPYPTGYSASAPLGNGVTINSTTGLISGIAPATTGPYIITVCINEFRGGVQIGTTKKEVLVTVADCSLTAASLPPSYVNCNNYSFNFKNESTSSNINSYLWDFGVTNTTSDTSHAATPAYTYTDTGTYTLKLKVTSSAGCTDSTTSVIKIYPGLTADFSFVGSCYQSPFLFKDASTYTNGTITGWLWNFGDTASNNNTATAKDTSHLYTTSGSKMVTLTVNTDKGCSDTATKIVTVNDKPVIVLPFTDTLICAGDKLPLIVQGSGTTFSWKPLYNINNENTATPVVYPGDTTVYTVIVTDKSCIDSASIKVNVLPFITVSLPKDTAICATDSITLQPNSYALSYFWNESGNSKTLSNYSIKNPKAAPVQNTTYYVTANLGHCQDKAQTTVYVSPYPTVSVSGDNSICYGSTAIIRGSTNAAYYNWSPAGALVNATTLQPTAKPFATTNYILTVHDTFYCPKSVSDTIKVIVIPPVKVNAGNDTAIVVNQPLQLSATSSSTYATFSWQPAYYLNNAAIYNPVATINSNTIDAITYYVKATTPEGCTGSDNITVFIYKTLPSIFIPTAFTPNGDGLNDVFKPTIAGIAQLYYFRVYNRWGQLVFETSKQNIGWNGMLDGLPQPSGTYVFAASGKDYLGKTVEKKGTVVLIR